MRLSKANFAGLVSPRQQSEMKSILAGTWPPLKPLPVFKYETAEYRATIDFDKKRGEWVCRKTSLPSNEVQELRGGLREITMALPHGEAEMSPEGAEQPEQELEKDAHRRLQAIHDWRENSENGARYFELRDYLSESQRSELDDSLRLALTARQLQFNAKNVASVFDDLAIAGGRFATLIEFAKRKKAKGGSDPQAEGEGAALEEARPRKTATTAERAIDHDEQSLEISSGELGSVLSNDDASVGEQEAAERCTDADELPALSVKNVFPEQDQGSLAEPMAHSASQQLEIETSEMVDGDSSPVVEHPQAEEYHSPAFAALTRQVRTGQSSWDRILHAPEAKMMHLVGGWFSRLPTFEKPARQVIAVASLFLFTLIAFTVGLKLGRGSLGRGGRETSKSMVAGRAKPATPPDQVHEETSRTPAPPVASSDGAAGTNGLDATTPSEEKSAESTRGAEDVAEVHSTDLDSSARTQSKPSADAKLNSGHSRATGLNERNVPPPASSKIVHSPKAIGPRTRAPRSPAPYMVAATTGESPHVARPSTILVTVPSRGKPFRVSFAKKAIATSSFAMSSQLSVLVSPEAGRTVAHQPARLEAGELSSFAWPHYPRPKDRYRSAETIRVRATIGQLGQVLDVKFLSGSASLLPATTGAIRQWRYTPTLLDKRPVQAEQDVTIEFRPPQYSLQASTQHPSHN